MTAYTTITVQSVAENGKQLANCKRNPKVDKVPCDACSLQQAELVSMSIVCQVWKKTTTIKLKKHCSPTTVFLFKGYISPCAQTLN